MVDDVVGFHHELVVVEGASAPLPVTGIPAAPVSTVATIRGGTGVTGAGGRLQLLPLGIGVSNRPSARLIALSSGKGSRQHRFEKSSRSTVQAAIPP